MANELEVTHLAFRCRVGIYVRARGALDGGLVLVVLVVGFDGATDLTRLPTLGVLRVVAHGTGL